MCNVPSCIIPAQLLASLAHTRAGITDAIVTMGAIEHLSAHLDSEDGEVDSVSLAYVNSVFPNL